MPGYLIFIVTKYRPNLDYVSKKPMFTKITWWLIQHYLHIWDYDQSGAMLWVKKETNTKTVY